MDDENCMVWNFHYSYGDHPMDDLGPRVADSGNAYGTHVDVENGFRSILNRSNDWGIDRDVQKTESFTGVDGINLQDRAVQESMGRIVDRSREHLGPADKAIIATRKLLLEAVEIVENSGDPRGTGPGYHEVRAAERTVPNGADWRQILLPAMYPVSHGSQPQVREQAGQLMVRDISFDDLKPQPPRDASNSRVPEPANDYGKQALARSREAAKQCRTVRDIPFGPDYYQKLDLYLPEDEAARDVPVLLYFHGGAWQHGYKEWNGFVAPVIVDLPAIFISASYRLVPEVNFPAPLDDAMAALDWVWRNIAAYGGDPNRLFSGGWSVGGTLASLVTLRRELYAPYGLPEDVIKACFAASGGYRYKHDVLAPGNSGKTYGDLMYERPEDELLAEPLHYVKGNHTPFYISWASDDFGHVMQSSQDMVDALKAEGCTVEYDVFNGVDHYDFNLAHGNPEDKWVNTVRRWITTT